MAADGWDQCPKCGANEDGEHECEGLREEFCIYINHDESLLKVTYYARCVDCGYEIKHFSAKPLTHTDEDAKLCDKYISLDAVSTAIHDWATEAGITRVNALMEKLEAL